MERVDVAIVGGGPGGSAAARAAAEADARAVVFEKGVPREDREGPGPDSTDAAGMLDYWLDVMDVAPDEIPDDVVLRELDSARFVGPSERVDLRATGIDATYDGFGFCYNRARLDDWLRAEAEEAGAEYRVGVGVRGLDSERVEGTYSHTLTLTGGEEVRADAVVLADGPGRQVTMGALDQFLPADASASERLAPPRANHIAYQEYRRFPEEVFDPDAIQFWWGWMPGETAYPWVFPNDGTVARVGLTMPIGMDLDDVENPESYRLLREDDEKIPAGREYVSRLLEELYGDEYDVESDFPRVEDRGKNRGTETYPISSTRPIESPVGANLAVVGGAMGATSAFHEGGTHVAVRTGKIAGRLAATGDLDRYNDEWKDAIGDEVLRNVAMADVVADYGPDDWDRTFRAAREMQAATDDGWLLSRRVASSATGGLKLYAAYKRAKFRYRKGKYAQVRESEYDV
jgi:electron-transferring-flavoprotein dehydrogenase